MTLRIISLHHTDPGFADCIAIRLDVFVQEQNVPVEEERDLLDAIALHFLALDDDHPVGTARALVKDAGKTIKIGRVAILRAARGRQIGAALMNAVEAAPEFANATGFVLDAQIQALPFYEKLSYVAEGDVFMDAGIPHLLMRKQKGKEGFFL